MKCLILYETSTNNKFFIISLHLMFKENMMDYPNTGDYLFKIIQKSCRDAAGMPLSVQVIGRPFQEELVLHAMREVERISVYRPKLKQN